jgi:hypothetical protein
MIIHAALVENSVYKNACRKFFPVRLGVPTGDLNDTDAGLHPA